MATNTITVNGPDTLKDSSEVWLRATNGITINSGFTVNQQGSLTISTGSGALAKKMEQKKPETPSMLRGFAQLPSKLALAVCATKRSTLLRYALPEQATVRISIFNMQGRRLACRFFNEKPAGLYTEEFTGGSLRSAGMYIAEISTKKNTRRTVFQIR